MNEENSENNFLRSIHDILRLRIVVGAENRLQRRSSTTAGSWKLPTTFADRTGLVGERKAGPGAARTIRTGYR